MYWKDIGTSVATVTRTPTAEPHLRAPDLPAGADLRTPLARELVRLPLARGGLRRARLPGGTGRKPPRAAGRRWPNRSTRASRSLAGADLAAAEPGRQGRPGAVDAGAPRQRRSPARPRPASSTPPPRQPGAVPDRPRHPAERPDRTEHLARAAGPPAGRSGLDRTGPGAESEAASGPAMRRPARRTDLQANREARSGRHLAARWAGPRRPLLILRRAESACPCRVPRRSTSSRSRSPCRSARARAAAS